MNFFLDNCISCRYARALKILAEKQPYEIAHLTDMFDRSNVKDEEWISHLARDGDWVIISGDPRITRGKAEQLAWRESGLTCFFFVDGWSSKSFWNQAEDIVRWWPLIVTKAKEARRGESFMIPVKGKEFKPINLF